MAVESFMPAGDAKITIEKAVKEKPSITELTTVESPGKPMPASMLEEKPRKSVKSKAKKKAPDYLTKVSQPNRDCILIITEKPQAAMKIASALGDPRKYTEDRVSYYEVSRNGENIVVASAVGHLFGLTYQKGQVGWPIFKLEWIPSYTKTAFTKPYYNLIKKLERRAKEIIIATDYDVEGEVIGWNVLRFLLKKNDAKRMKYSTLTKNELIKAYENPMSTLDWGQAYAGETRHQIDWLYGINLSRALMSAIKKTGSFRLLSIGRVQGPALKIIVDREKEIDNFKPVPYWQVFALAKDVKFKHIKDILDKNELDEFKDIKEGEVKTELKDEILPPPFPFDLTTLQREAYKLHNITPANTLKIAQSLYLDGIISYPRTSSQKIPKEIEPKKILKALEKNFLQVRIASRQEPIEGPKSDPAHPSIYPTGEFKKLENDEKKIYELIAKRFISAFCPDAKIANKKLTLIAKEKKFTASASTVLEKGWTEVYPMKIEEKTLPDMSGKIKVDKITFEEKETQPPHRYTPASLITILEKKNLGTKATRSSIIETLFDRGYLEGQSIKATPLGRKLIDSLEKYSPIIVDENLTRDLEEKMEEIHSLKQGHEEKEKKVIENVEKLITDISKEFKINELEIGKSLQEGTQELREMQKENSIIMPCPVCKVGNLCIKYSPKLRRNFVACDKYPECKTTFSLPPNSLIKRTGKTSPEGLPILVAIRKGKRPWEFPFNPNWRAENQKKD